MRLSHAQVSPTSSQQRRLAYQPAMAMRKLNATIATRPEPPWATLFFIDLSYYVGAAGMQYTPKEEKRASCQLRHSTPTHKGHADAYLKPLL